MCFLNGWLPFESIRFDLVKITMWRCLVLQIWEQQKQLLLKQRVIQLGSYHCTDLLCVSNVHTEEDSPGVFLIHF